MPTACVSLTQPPTGNPMGPKHWKDRGGAYFAGSRGRTSGMSLKLQFAAPCIAGLAALLTGCMGDNGEPAVIEYRQVGCATHTPRLAECGPQSQMRLLSFTS